MAMLALGVVAVLLLRAGVLRAADEITVCASGCDHTSIQAAIDSAAPGDTIVLTAETYSETIIVDRQVTIRGTDATSSIIDGSDGGTVITILAGTSLTLESLAVRNGRTTANGGGILNQGVLVARSIDVSANVAATVASSGGGGIYSTGQLTMVDSTIAENQSQTGGGGIYVSGPTAVALIERTEIVGNSVRDLTTDFRGGGGLHVASGDATVRDSRIVNNRTDFTGGGVTVRGSGSDVEIINTTIDGNTSRLGAGIRAQSSARLTITGSTISNNRDTSGEISSGGGLRASTPVTITNSTIVGNAVNGSGGGISAESTVTLDSVTIAGNSAAFGGGIASFSAGTTLIANSIVAGNVASSSGNDCGGTLDGGADLLIGDADDCTLSGVSGVIIADPRLGPLQDNGGPTLTLAPDPASPAVDAGATSLTTDQRGQPRPAGPMADIGAVELQPVTPTPTSSPSPFLATPTDLTAEALSMDTIRLRWFDNSMGEDGYEVQRHDGVDFVRHDLLPPNVTTFFDDGLEADTLYVYRVRSFVGTTQFSEFSDIAAATTLGRPTISLPWIIVDAQRDGNLRDGLMTLREAMMIAAGSLDVGDLDADECDQLLNTSFNGVCSITALLNSWSIGFDPAVFPVSSPKRILLGGPLPEVRGAIRAALGAFVAGVIVESQFPIHPCFEMSSDGNTVAGLQITGCDIGVRITSAANNKIGGTGANERNVIFGNNTGVLIEGSGSTGNQVYGNYIGTRADGMVGAPNGVGISMSDAPANLVGGTEAGARNVVSGNGTGLLIEGSGATLNEINGNYIGTASDGLNALPNDVGVLISQAHLNQIGGQEAGAGNLIAGNTGDGVRIAGGLSNTVAGNLIGTAATGLSQLQNGGAGVRIVGGVGNTIGGSADGAGNVLSGNVGGGIHLDGRSVLTVANMIRGNLIGTDVTGVAALPNGGAGIRFDSADSNTVGGAVEGAGNVVAGNDDNGITLNRSDGNTIQGNHIGTDETGLSALPNEGNGISIFSGQNTIVGGAAANAGNLISGNRFSGMDVRASNNTIQGNMIGTDATGLGALPNALDGVFIGGGEGNLIGGTGPGAGNVISGNSGDGIRIASDGNMVEGNLIGTVATGNSALPNGVGGVHVDGSEANVIGGIDPSAGNVISGNNRNGITLNGRANRVQENRIGTTEAGTTALPNGAVGIFIGESSGATGSVPGADNLIFRNTIAFNVEEGVLVDRTAESGNRIRFNSIHHNLHLGIEVHIGGTALPSVRDPMTEDLAGLLVLAAELQGEKPNTAYLIDLYANGACDPSGFGQGERYVATTTLVTDQNGDATSDVVVGQPVAPGEFITATATDQPTGSTSSFSVCEKVLAPPVVPAADLNVRCVHSPLWPQPGDRVTITAEALDGSLDRVILADNIEIWFEDRTAPVASGPASLGIRAHATAPLSSGFVDYGCRVQDGAGTAFSGWRKFTVGDSEPVIAALAAVPILYNGSTSEAIDIVFIADHDVYSGPDDADFLAGAAIAVTRGYYGQSVFLTNQTRLNFWIAINTGSGSDYNQSGRERNAGLGSCADGIDNDGDGLIDEDDGDCRTFCSDFESPAGWNTLTVFADAGAILHSNQYRDCAPSGRRLFSAEVTQRDYPRVAVHETGHTPFGLADEYAPDGGYWQDPHLPNVYTSFFACLVDAVSLGRTGDDCRQWNRKRDNKPFWTSDPAANDLMVDNQDPQLLDLRRILWMFDQCEQGNC